MRFACSAIALAAIGLLSGCATVQVGVTNPIPGLTTVAVAPFFNLSQEPEFVADGRRVALAYFAELQKVPGFQVIPVGVTEDVIKRNNLELSDPDDALRLCELLGCDAVVVGAITDYDPYYPPRMGLQVSWYSPYEWQFVPGIPIDPQARNRLWQADLDARREARRCEAIERQKRLESGPGCGLRGEGCLRRDRDDCEPCPTNEDGCPPGKPRDCVSIRGQSPDLPYASANGSADLNAPSAAVSSGGTWWEGELRTFGQWNTDGAAGDVPGEPPAPPGGFRPPKVALGPRTNSPYVRKNPAPSDEIEIPFGAPSSEVLTSKDAAAEAMNPRPRRRAKSSAQSSTAATRQSTIRAASNEVPAPTAKLAPPRTRLAQGPALAPPPASGSEAAPLPELVETLPPFDPRQPLMSYTRLFDGSDAAFVATLRDWLELNANRRAGGWEASLHRTEEFIRCCSHLMIVEMLTLHGGESQRRLVIKTRNYR